MAWDNNPANILPAAVAAIYVKASGDTDYYSLGDLFDGQAVYSELSQSNKTKVAKGFSIQIEIKAKLMWTHKTYMIAKLATMVGLKLNFVIVLVNGQTLSSENITEQFFGFKPTFVNKGDLDSIRYVEILIDRKITGAEWTQMLSTAPDVSSTPDAGDTLFGLASMTTADERAAGISKIEFRLAAGSSWDNDLGIFRNVDQSFEFLTVKDQFGRSRSQGQVKCMTSVEGLQSVAAELALLASSGSSVMLSADFDFKMTLMDATVLTFDNPTNSLGITFDVHNDKESEDVQFIKFAINGNILVSAFAGIIS